MSGLDGLSRPGYRTQTGRLVAFTAIAIGPPDMVQEGYGRRNPYGCGVIELQEDVRVVARIDGVDMNNPESIKVGMQM